MDHISTQQNCNWITRKIENSLKIQTCFLNQRVTFKHLLWAYWHIHDLKLWHFLSFLLSGTEKMAVCKSGQISVKRGNIFKVLELEELINLRLNGPSHPRHGCSNHSNLETEAECLTKTLSCLNLNISRTKNGRNKL